MSQHRNEVVVVESTPVEHLSTPSDQGDGVLELDFVTLDRIVNDVITEDQNSEFARFTRVSEDGREPLAAVMSFMASNCTYRALSVICQGNNWRRIAFALGLVFHTSEHIPLRVQIARGHDRLRDLVTTCVTDLRREGRNNLLDEYGGAYSRMVQRLFTSHGHQAP